MSSGYSEGCIFVFIQVYTVLFQTDGGRGLHSHPDNQRHAGCDTAKDTAVMVPFGSQLIVFKTQNLLLP